MDLFEYAEQRNEPKKEEVAPTEAIYTVGEITAEIKALLEGKYGRERIWVKGEVSNFKGRNQTGHMYFSLKDETSLLGCAYFRNANKNLSFELKDGQSVLAAGRISLYAPRGNYQLIIEEIRPGGTGELYLRFEMLKKKLEAEGLFAPERKRPLPPFPKRIGLVTSATGAVVRDVIHVIRRRCPFVAILLFPVKVQGEGAAEEIVKALEEANDERHALEVIIAGRGGGSIEDLWAFNEEAVARAIAQSRLPVVSAVGHQTDFTIADFVADQRAATPSQAAELVVPDTLEVRRRVEMMIRTIVRELSHAREKAVERLDGLKRSAPLRDPRNLIRARRERVERAVERMMGQVSNRNDQERARFERNREHLRLFITRALSPRRLYFEKITSNLSLLNPLAILSRGYSVVSTSEGKIINKSRDVSVGESLSVRLHEGGLKCRVTETLEK